MRLGDSNLEDAKAEILLVDDKPENLELLATLLEEQGYEIREAISGSMALQAAQAAPPDLILLDINMPGMTGYEVCQQLKANPQTAPIPVIFISALDEAWDKVKSFTVGGVDYITKPFQVIEVLARVENQLRIQSLQRQLHQKNLILEAQQARLEAELSRAAEIQQNLLPKESPSISGLKLAAQCLPAREVGGDFYDWFQPSSHQLCLTLGDVMGKGMPAALLMATVRATLRASLEAFKGTDQLSQIISCVNVTLEPDLLLSEAFITLIHFQIDFKAQTLTYVDAGHGLGFVCRASGLFEKLTCKNPPLGVGHESYQTATVPFGPGDSLVVYSDGLADALTWLYQEIDQLKAYWQDTLPPQQQVKTLIELALKSETVADDMTIVVMHYQQA